MSREDLEACMDPEKYTGRAKEQVEEYLAEVVKPLLKENEAVLGQSVKIDV